MSRGGLREAIDHAEAGRWDEVHAIAQDHEGESLADWLHAVVHKVEGDAGNARSWYRRAGRMVHESDEPGAELEKIRAAVTAAISSSGRGVSSPADGQRGERPGE